MNTQKKIVYSYENEQGDVLFKKIRVENEDGSKSFYFEREENGQIVRNMNGCRHVLYKLPQLLEAIAREEPIFLVEGEKDAETIIKWGWAATTAPITRKWEESFTQILKGAQVALFYDNDKAGVNRRDMITSQLYNNTKRFRIIDLPGIEYSESHGKDVTDWLEIPGNDIKKLEQIIYNTPDHRPPQKDQPEQLKGPLRVITLNELIALELPERAMLLHPFLPSQGLVMLAAKRGVGKTHAALGIAYAVASGGTFLNWYASTAKKVLYIDGEMPAVQMQERLRIIADMSDTRPEEQFLQLITPDLQERPIPDLSTKQGRDIFEEYIKDRDLIVIDNLSCLFRSGNENDAECWQEAQEWALDLRRRGKSILFIHHTGKSGTQRGTSKKEDILDAVVLLKHPDDYKASEGARFEVHFDKARHFSGEAAKSFVAHLRQENDNYVWHISNGDEEELLKEIVHMRATGLTIQAIVEKTGRSKSQIETLIKKAKTREIIQ
jgi:5S rRNA maturation endonuclease (ribonuclease M5)